jgi:hypothetical protein
MFNLVGTARFLNNLHHALLIVKKIGKPNNLNSLGTSKANGLNRKSQAKVYLCHKTQVSNV